MKAVLSKSDAKEQLFGAMNEYDKQIDKARYLPEEMTGSKDSKVGKTLEQLESTRRAIELTLTLLS